MNDLYIKNNKTGEMSKLGQVTETDLHTTETPITLVTKETCYGKIPCRTPFCKNCDKLNACIRQKIANNFNIPFKERIMAKYGIHY